MADTNAERDELKVTTPEFRGSFVHLAKPRAYGDKEPKYQMVVVVSKGEVAFWKAIKRVTRLAAERKFGRIPEKLVTTIKDGDAEGREEWAGCFAFRAQSGDRPGTIDRRGEKIIDPGELYSGARYVAVVRAFAWHHLETNRKGVSLSLDNVMKVADDEPFSGRAKPEDDFADFIERDGEEDGGYVDPMS